MRLIKNIKKFSIQSVFWGGCCALFSLSANSQVSSSIDSTAIKIGEELRYSIKVDTDTTALVVFSEAQTFQPLEIINSYPIDTMRKGAYYKLTKTYGLTQFDSGVYTLPRQKVLIVDKTYYTDSLKVQVNPVAIDTTKQKLFDIKPIVEVHKTRSISWLNAALFLLIFLFVGLGLYWFFWRKKPLTEAEKIAALPPYERARLALEKLDEELYFKNKDVKTFYSDLTLILRQYLDEKVYDQSLESTTDELVFRLKTLQAANQITLSANTIKNIEIILKRADLVKFAKSKPDFELAKLDKGTIGVEIEQVKKGLPEPTEEELLKDLAYKEKAERQKKRRKFKQLIVAGFAVGFMFVVGLIINYGFTAVKDTVLRNPSKILLETPDWVTSEYGAPGITLSTPEVLERLPSKLAENGKEKVRVASFVYAGGDTPFDISVNSSTFSPEEKEGKNKEEAIDLLKVADLVLDRFEKEGAKNIVSRSEPFTTPKAQEGLKTFGSAEFLIDGSLTKSDYVILGFSTPKVLQQLVLRWKTNDIYAKQIMDRILNSIELVKLMDKEN